MSSNLNANESLKIIKIIQELKFLDIDLSKNNTKCIYKHEHNWLRLNSTDPLPSGAIKAGYDTNGKPIYIGRAYHCGDLIPAKVVNNQFAEVGHGGSVKYKQNFDVLCDDENLFCWKFAKNGSIVEKAVAVGSTTAGEKLYLGRVFFNGAQLLGKIHPSYRVCFIPYEGYEKIFKEYEVFAYK